MKDTTTCQNTKCSARAPLGKELCAQCEAKVPRYWCTRLEKARKAYLAARATGDIPFPVHREYAFTRDACIGAAQNEAR